MLGTVKFFSRNKGYGFIVPNGGGRDVFVHMTVVKAAGLRTLRGGQEVFFDIEETSDGPHASNLRMFGEEQSREVTHEGRLR